MRTKFGIALVTLTASLTVFGTVLPAQAAEFSPETTFTLSKRKVNANPALTIAIKQEAGEEEVDAVKLRVPKGFKIPKDSAIADNTDIGDGQIKIAGTPLCNDASKQTVDVTIVERDRTDEEKSAGVRAVWVVDLEPVTRVRLTIKGTPARGYIIKGNIPQNGATCPPFEFNATIFQKAAGTDVKIIRNPSSPGKYRFTATWTGTQGSIQSYSSTVKIVA